MKALLNLISFISLALVGLNATLTGETPFFFLGEFEFRDIYPDKYDISISCCPYGKIQMNRDLENKTQIIIMADLWVGAECQNLGFRSSTSRFIIPFPYQSSLNQIEGRSDLYNPAGVKFTVSQAARGPAFIGPDSMDFNITMDYMNVVNGGETCSVLMNKQALIIQAFSLFYMSLFAILYF